MLTSVAEQSMGLATGAIGFLGSLASAMISIVMFVIALYYFLADGPALLSASEGLIPVHVEYQRQLFKQFNQVIRAVVLSTLLATAVALWAIGVPHFFLVFMLATIASMIPLAGSWIVWGPFAVWLAFTGQWWQAGMLTLFGSVVIGTMDNVIRTYVLNSDAKLHPLLAFVSVLGGLQAMGLWGVFVGPVVASCLHALVQIFNSELKEFSVTRLAEAQANEGDAPAAALMPAQPDGRNASQPATPSTAVT